MGDIVVQILRIGILGMLALTPLHAQAQSEATKEEIVAAFVGKTATFSDGGVVTYGTDGSYKYVASSRTWVGNYDILAGKICVTFRGGNFRCDTIMKNGDEFVLINRSGSKFSVTFK
jgi:hypothetical protein